MAALLSSRLAPPSHVFCSCLWHAWPSVAWPLPSCPLCRRDHLVIEDLEELLPSERDAKSAMVRTDRGGGGASSQPRLPTAPLHASVA